MFDYVDQPGYQMVRVLIDYRGRGKHSVERKENKKQPEGIRGCKRLEMWDNTTTKPYDINLP